MNCMKCGRETISEQAFCDDCLIEMQKYPVNPNTPVQLPKRAEYAIKKIQKRKTVPLEDQIKTLKKHIRLLYIALLITSVLVLVLAYPAIEYLREDHFALGQNYSTITPSTTAAPETTAP